MSSYHQDQAKQTDAELCEDSTTIEPEYTRSHVIAEQIMARFEAEQFKPLMKKIEDHVSEHLWDMVQDSMISDTTHNIAGHIRHRVESTINALLGGHQWSVDKYVMANYGDGQRIRQALAAVIAPQLVDARITDLEKENETLRKNLQRERECNNR